MFEVQLMVIVRCHLLFETFNSAQQLQCQSMLVAVLQNSFPLKYLCIQTAGILSSWNLKQMKFV